MKLYQAVQHLSPELVSLSLFSFVVTNYEKEEMAKKLMLLQPEAQFFHQVAMVLGLENLIFQLM